MGLATIRITPDIDQGLPGWMGQFLKVTDRFEIGTGPELGKIQGRVERQWKWQLFGQGVCLGIGGLQRHSRLS